SSSTASRAVRSRRAPGLPRNARPFLCVRTMSPFSIYNKLQNDDTSQNTRPEEQHQSKHAFSLLSTRPPSAASTAARHDHGHDKQNTQQTATERAAQRSEQRSFSKYSDISMTIIAMCSLTRR